MQLAGKGQATHAICTTDFGPVGDWQLSAAPIEYFPRVYLPVCADFATVSVGQSLQISIPFCYRRECSMIGLVMKDNRE
jgi:hypothetical protein